MPDYERLMLMIIDNITLCTYHGHATCASAFCHIFCYYFLRHTDYAAITPQRAICHADLPRRLRLLLILMMLLLPP